MSRSAFPVAMLGAAVTVVGLMAASVNAVPGHGLAAHRPATASATVSGLSVLSGVACPTSAHCVAVGSDSNLENGKSVLITTATGAVTVGHGAVKDASLNAVACPTKAKCVAVSDENVAIVKAASGAVHQTAKLKPPADGIVALGAIACESKKTCFGVGFEGSPSDGTAVVADISAAGKVVGITKGHGTGIGNIACPSSTRCLISIADSGGTFIQVLTNGKFGARHAVTGRFVESMSCFKGKICMALGGKSGGTVSHIDQLYPINPKTGALGKTIQVKNFDGDAINCFTATKCRVAGATPGSTTAPAAVIVTKGKPGHAKQYPGDNGGFHASACAGPTHCYGVGSNTTGAQVDRL